MSLRKSQRTKKLKKTNHVQNFLSQTPQLCGETKL